MENPNLTVEQALEMQAKFKKLQEDLFRIKIKVETDGVLPVKANQEDAGFDLYATSDISLLPGQVLKHPLNIRLQLPVATWANVTTKSGLGSRGHLVYAGVIDSGYRGVVHAVMTNVNLIQGLDEHGIPLMNTAPLVIKKGEKIAQLIISPHNPLFYMEQTEELDMNTSRGEGGFGSTGV
jgi:dUTP pyrophosphatase